MKKIAIANQKGGSAKTTSAVSLAAALAANGRRVLLLDMDPQCSATAWVSELDEDSDAFERALCGEVPLSALVEPTRIPGVDAIPGSTALGRLHKTLADELASELCLSRALRDLDENRWDVAIMDTPPTMGLLVFASLAVADHVLAPVEVSPMAVAGLQGLVERIEKVRRALNDKLDLIGVLACRVNDRTVLSREVVDSLREDFPGKVFETGIREAVRVREAWAWRRSLLEHDPSGNATLDYMAAAKELETRLQLDAVGAGQ